jgi:DNA polymerase-3 subunit beta
MDGDAFPPMSEANYDISFSIRGKTLRKSFDIAKVAMLLDNSRFHLGGVHMHYENTLGHPELRFVATDLFRIACVSTGAPKEAQNMNGIIMSKRTVSEILRLLDNNSDTDVQISVSENRVAFKFATSDRIVTEFTARLINGTFPEYRTALDVSNDKILTVNKGDIMSALGRVSSVVTDATSSVRLEIHSDKLVLTGVSREFGRAVEEVDASFNALEKMDICFNSRYLLEILREIETPQVQLLFAERNSSAIIRPMQIDEVPEVDMVFAVMPIEVIEE